MQVRGKVARTEFLALPMAYALRDRKRLVTDLLLFPFQTRPLSQIVEGTGVPGRFRWWSARLWVFGL